MAGECNGLEKAAKVLLDAYHNDDDFDLWPLMKDLERELANRRAAASAGVVEQVAQLRGLASGSNNLDGETRAVFREAVAALEAALRATPAQCEHPLDFRMNVDVHSEWCRQCGAFLDADEWLLPIRDRKSATPAVTDCDRGRADCTCPQCRRNATPAGEVRRCWMHATDNCAECYPTPAGEVGE